MANIPQDVPTTDGQSAFTPRTYSAREMEKIEEHAAMRAYLQRAEVRLSTMHRVAGVLLNGAGLLFLFPVLLKMRSYIY